MSETSSSTTQRNPKTTILLVLAAAVVVALGYLAYSSQRPNEPAPQAAERTAPTEAPRSVTPPPRPGPAPVRQPRPMATPAVTPPSEQPASAPRTNLTRTDIRSAQARLHRAADGCVAEALKNKPDMGLRMAIRYTLVVQNGEARAANPTIVKSMLGDPDVEKCILDKIQETRWQVTASDGAIPVAESFNFKHLTRTHISE